MNTLPYLSCQRSSSPKDVQLGVRQPMANQIFQFNISELSKDTGALKETFEAGNLPAVAAKLQATLHSLEDVRLDIGVTGAIGSGKSTFVNAIRGLGDEDPKSAGTGVVEMTVEPTPYPHPKYLNIIIWDLPGIDAPTFQADEYLQRVLVDRYDFFIIITPDSFTARHAQLAHRLLQQGKGFYFVRSKVDVDLAASRSRRPRTFSEQRVLRQIREDCWQRLEGEVPSLGGPGVGGSLRDCPPLPFHFPAEIPWETGHLRSHLEAEQGLTVQCCQLCRVLVSAHQ